MADLKKLIDDQIAAAFNTILKPGNLTVETRLRYFVSKGKYDPETDSVAAVYDEVPDITAILAKPGFTDVKDHGVSMSDGKLIIPGSFIPREPDTDTDRIAFNNRDWNIRKCVGVPGQGVYLIFVNL